MSHDFHLNDREIKKLEKDISKKIDALDPQVKQDALELQRELEQALRSDNWEEEVDHILDKTGFFDRDAVEGLRDEHKAVKEFRENIDRKNMSFGERLNYLFNSTDKLQENFLDHKPTQKPQGEREKISRGKFMRKVGGAALGYAILGAFIGNLDYEIHAAEEGAEATAKITDGLTNGHKNTALTVVDTMATLNFVRKVSNLATGKESTVTKSDYMQAIAENVARCIVGGKETTHHTLEEHEFGFQSAGIAVLAGMAAEGTTARLDDMLRGLQKKKDVNLADKVAMIALIASGLSPMALTISSCSALGDEIRDIAYRAVDDKSRDQIMAVLMGHAGDHSAMVSLGYGDPPDVPFYSMVGWENGVKLKAAYGTAPAVYALGSTIYKTNYLLTGDHKSAANLTKSGMKSVLPILPALLAYSAANTGRAMGLTDMDPRGLTVEVAARMVEAGRNFGQIVSRNNPDSEHRFSVHHGYVSQLMKDIGPAMTTFMGNQVDSMAQQFEHVLADSEGDHESRIRNYEVAQKLLKRALTAETKEQSSNMFMAATDVATKGLGKDNSKRVKTSLHAMWALNDQLRFSDESWGTRFNPFNMMGRIANDKRLADAFGHEQMDVMMVLPWQLLKAVPASGAMQVLLDGMDSFDGLPKQATAVTNMLLTGAMTGTVDNMAAYLASANASIRSEKPRIMQALMSSIVFGSATWLGNPIAHGKVGFLNAIPGAEGPNSIVYGVQESMRPHNLKMNADVYAVTMGSVLVNDALGMETKILGDEHPAFKAKHNPVHDSHSSVIKPSGLNLG